MGNSKRKRRRRKSKIDRPPKPYPTFPLCAANCGRWQKKIRGSIHYFSSWGRVVNGKMTRIQEDGGWREALELYESQVADLHAGKTPRGGEGPTAADLCNRFLTAKLRAVESGELAPRSFIEYRNTTDRLIAQFGKRRLIADLDASDFAALRAEAAKGWGPTRLGNEVQRVRSIFKFSYDAGLIDRPVRFGPEFRKPPLRVLRRHRAKNGRRMFEAAEVRSLLAAAPVPLQAMIWLGINSGFGNSDCSALPMRALDLANGWVLFPRPKTGIERRCPLWKETTEALKVAIDRRPTPKDTADVDLVFVTKQGHPWVRTHGKNHVPIDAVGGQFNKLLRATKLKRPGLGFYGLRHTFRTVADATKDHPAIRLVMGHCDSSIDDSYRERIDDERLVAVAEYVRRWLFGAKGGPGDE